MTPSGHGGARAGAGRKASAERKVKRSVTLSVATDAAVLAAMQADESYSEALERLLRAAIERRDGGERKRSSAEVLVATLGPEREAVASVYRRLGWSRQEFERVIQATRPLLGQCGVRLYVAPKVAASGRREQYIMVDGMRYSAMSRDERATAEPESRASPRSGGVANVGDTTRKRKRSTNVQECASGRGVSRCDIEARRDITFEGSVE